MEKSVTILLAVVLVLSITIYCYTLRKYKFAQNTEDFGIFGDYIGGIVGTLVGLMGIVFLYRTYKIQLDIADTQDKLQIHQQFESTFFSLLNEQRSILLNLRGNFPLGSDQTTVTSTSYEYIQKFRNLLSEGLTNLLYEPYQLAPKNKNRLKIKVNEIYTELFLSHSNELGPYFRHLYHLLKFIDDSDVENKKEYADIVQSQMSFDELYILAVNGISNYGRKRLLPLLNDYSFLENLVIDDDDIVRKLVRIFYPNTKDKTPEKSLRNIIVMGGLMGPNKSNLIKAIGNQVAGLELLPLMELVFGKKHLSKRSGLMNPRFLRIN